ncbi:minor extracellular protease Epr [Evansella caseinilytica]|uniref:Minor extracellular protease Epr n=1 Tax=Evansella caseinilytica TaxID=1503961 RepID=A0A1H3IJ85_9BACI|nr:S8 family serine peptidase [Evansella caseinilytica]SDY27913.1 minor extracellular protease Epr [Evansella caseinilytica]
MDIINLSLGSTQESAALRQAVDKAYANGVVVAAAAGNSGTQDDSGDTVVFPAKYPSAIAVAASDKNNQRGTFSSTGEAIEVSAPGVQVLSTYLGNGYVRMKGTSMAAPFVAGNHALYREKYPQAGAAELRKLLQENTVDLVPAGKDSLYGYGLIQAPEKVNIDPEPMTPTEPDVPDQVVPVQPIAQPQPVAPSPQAVEKAVPKQKKTTAPKNFKKNYRHRGSFNLE